MPSTPTPPTNLPSEAIELYNDFIHGEISRRSFMEGTHKVAGTLAASAVIASLMSNCALGQQVSRNDDRIKATHETVPSPKGNGSKSVISSEHLSAKAGNHDEDREELGTPCRYPKPRLSLITICDTSYRGHFSKNPSR